MALEVVMDCKGSVYPVLDDSEVINAQDQRVADCGLNESQASFQFSPILCCGLRHTLGEESEGWLYVWSRPLGHIQELLYDAM